MVSQLHPPALSGKKKIKLAIRSEREVGEAIKASGIPRSEVFITSKVCVHRVRVKT
jgi:diketogulonate reductase-like aldo/keto reductase